jgi:hypothetical protein
LLAFVKILYFDEVTAIPDINAASNAQQYVNAVGHQNLRSKLKSKPITIDIVFLRIESGVEIVNIFIMILKKLFNIFK